MPPKCVLMVFCLSVVCIPSAFAGVTVTSPANGATLQGPVTYVASATTSCSKGVGSMGIYTAPGVLAYVVNGSSMNTTLSLPATNGTPTTPGAITGGTLDFGAAEGVIIDATNGQISSTITGSGGMTMGGAGKQRSQNEHVESALKEIEALFVGDVRRRLWGGLGNSRR